MRVLKNLRPYQTAWAAAILLFLVYIPKWLTFLSPMFGSYAFDFFNLPRCGLALLNGTNIYTSSDDYQFGYFATPWVSHPMLCLTLGIPFSRLDPWVGFWIFNFLMLCIHLYILFIFDKKILTPERPSEKIYQHLAMACLGFFFPWYMNYHLGQYHLIFVLALCFALTGREMWGFCLSGLGKPALAPAALSLLTSKRWRTCFIICIVLMLGYIPFLFLRLDSSKHIILELNKSYFYFVNNAGLSTHFSVRGWDQEMGWVKVFDELWSGDHYPFRMAMIGGFSLMGAWIARRNFSFGVAMSSLWFFFSYGRIHEYHYASFVPLLAWALTQPGFKPRNIFLASLFLALPTIWFLLRDTDSFIAGKGLDFNLARKNHAMLFWIWTLHRPLSVLYVLILMLRAWVFQRTAST